MKSTRSKVYGTWKAMKNRCTNPKDSTYKYFGAKGIGIAEDWLNFKLFYLWAINNGWTIGKSIGLIDSTKDYSADNCQWMSYADLMKNNQKAKVNAVFYDTDLEHYERLKTIFGDEQYIDGEYPFYVDDRLMEEDNGTVTKKAYADGKRVSVRMFPTSMQTFAGECQMNEQIVNDEVGAVPKVKDRFSQYTLSMWQTLLTRRQVDFVVAGTLEGNETKYYPQLRYRYRGNMTSRLRKAYLGIGGDSIPVHMVNELKTKSRMVSKFMDISDDNTLFQKYIVKKLDTEFVMRIVYDMMTTEGRQDIVNYYCHKTTNICIQSLNEFYNHILDEHDRLSLLGIV